MAKLDDSGEVEHNIKKIRAKKKLRAQILNRVVFFQKRKVRKWFL